MAESTSTTPTTQIPILALGTHRFHAASTVPLFQGTQYSLSAIVDVETSPAPFSFSPQSFGATLYALIPRPKVLIVGAFTEEKVWKEAEKVWGEWVEWLGSNEGGDLEEGKGGEGKERRLVINMTKEPPKDEDWAGHILGQLDAVFGNKG